MSTPPRCVDRRHGSHLDNSLHLLDNESSISPSASFSIRDAVVD